MAAGNQFFDLWTIMTANSHEICVFLRSKAGVRASNLSLSYFSVAAWAERFRAQSKTLLFLVQQANNSSLLQTRETKAFSQLRPNDTWEIIFRVIDAVIKTVEKCELQRLIEQFRDILWVNSRQLMGTSTKRLAPEAGLEPATRRLTAGCSTIELLWNKVSFLTPQPCQQQECKPNKQRILQGQTSVVKRFLHHPFSNEPYLACLVLYSF